MPDPLQEWFRREFPNSPGEPLRAPQVTPPASLQHLHDDRLFGDLWRRLLAVIRSPVQQFSADGSRYVQVVGCVVLAIRPDGQIEVFPWVCTGLGQFHFEPLDPWSVALQGMPYRRLWLDMLAGHAAHEVLRKAEDRGVEASIDLARIYAYWA